jgi:homoserine O-acetyltransferase
MVVRRRETNFTPPLFAAIFALAALLVGTARAATWPTPTEGDHTISNFRFVSGESLPDLKLHYRTLGAIHKDKKGHVDNAVLIMHGTGGAGTQFLQDRFAGELFGAGQPLDATTYFIVLIDDIGHGKSSKPSDGLRMKFPHYTYDDMVVAEYRVLTRS